MLWVGAVAAVRFHYSRDRRQLLGARGSLVGHELQRHRQVETHQEHSKLDRLAVMSLLVFEGLLGWTGGPVIVLHGVDLWQNVDGRHVEERPGRDQHQDPDPELEGSYVGGAALGGTKSKEDDHVHQGRARRESL